MAPSRIHELARKSRIELLAILQAKVGPLNQVATMAVAHYDKDRLITAIRNIEAPDHGITAQLVRDIANSQRAIHEPQQTEYARKSDPARYR